MSASDKYVTLTDLQLLIKEQLRTAFPLPYWVVAEVSELKVNYSGHCYLELVEKGGENQVPRAKVSAVIWRNHYAMISSYFRTATGNELCSGLKVLIKVMVSYHELYGLSFQVTDIEPSYTLGDMEAQRRETIDRLQREGIYDMNRSYVLPPVLQRLAVVSSRNAAGYQDFMNELTGNPQGYRYDVTLFDAFMQGNETENSVISALDLIADRMDDFDAVVMIRGGGSQSDLGAFNSYRLCSHLAQFPLPVVTGIGHDKDQSVADLVANVSVKTPTAVAVFLNDHNERFEAGMINRLTGILELARDNLHNERMRLSENAYRLQHISQKFVHDTTGRLDGLMTGILRRSRLALETQKGRLALLGARISETPLRRTETAGHRLDTYRRQLFDLTRLSLSSKSRELNLLASVVEAKTPERILKMGYSIVRVGKRIVKNAGDLQPGDVLSVQLRDGKAEARVLRTTSSENKTEKKPK